MTKTDRRKSSKLLSRIPSNYRISEDVLRRVDREVRADVRDTLKVMNAVSNPIRLRILRALKVEELCVCVFVGLMRCEYSKLSYHLKLLKKAGLVESAKDKNFLAYRLTTFGRGVLKSIED